MILHRELFWAVLLYHISMNLCAANRQTANGQAQLLFRIKQGVRYQREAFRSIRAKTALDCALSCFNEKTAKSFNYAEYSPDNDAHENCQLLDEASDNSKEFQKDERYTFYQILVIHPVSQESENTQTTANVTTQIFDSCLGHFNHGSKTSGYYYIVEPPSGNYKVYCDMESEPGFVWTLVMSFTRENNHLQAFRSRAMFENGVKNKYNPNWSKYRMGLFGMLDLKNISTHWRITCSFPQYGVNDRKDYVRAVFADFDLMGEFWNECKRVDYISVMGQNCSNCTAHWWQRNGTATPHIAAIQDDRCDLKSDKTENRYFGAYVDYNTEFRCTKTATSSTNYWFGSHV